jgi:hypothetical protein
MDVCKKQSPPSLPVGKDQVAACWLHSPEHNPGHSALSPEQGPEHSAELEPESGSQNAAAAQD